MKNRVSIIIPVYNAEKYLEECLDSAVNQTYTDIEVIAVNDGSTDNSLEILKKYQNKIKIINKENGGTASALNLGIKHMTGEWFKWLSADDVLYPNTVEELLKELSKYKNKKNTILYSNFELINSSGKIVDKQIEPNYNKLSNFDFNVILLDHFVGNAITSIIHKSSINEYGNFDEKIGTLEDYELWLRYCILNNCRLYLLPKFLAKYRIHENQLTKTKILHNIETGLTIQKKILSSLDSITCKKYQEALKKYKKTKPLNKRTKRILRNVMVKYLPYKISENILKIYSERNFKIKKLS